jgi:hypothetical protein
LARLLDTTPKTIADVGNRGIIVRAGRGRWQLEASITGTSSTCGRKLRVAVARVLPRHATSLLQAQADLARLKADQLAGRLGEAEDAERLWTQKLKALRTRIQAIGDRLRNLPPRDHAACDRASQCTQRACRLGRSKA